MIEYVCVDGGSITPFIIFKGEKVMSSCIPMSALDLNWLVKRDRLQMSLDINGWYGFLIL